MTINLSKHAGGGNYEVYDPGMMTYDGSTGYYTITTDINVVSGLTVVARFKWDGGTITSAGGFNRFIAQVLGSTYYKAQLVIINDETGDDRAGCVQLAVNSSSNSQICNVVSNTVVSDGGEYVVFAAYDPVAGTAQLYVDGVSDINTSATGYLITTGTIATGSNVNSVGTRDAVDRIFDGEIGYFGIKGSYLTNPTDFYHPTNGLQELDETTWTEWGAQPLFYSPNGAMENNLGSAGGMTKNGTIDLASPSTIVIPAGLGLTTIGDATEFDIAIDKIAWVDGVELIGISPLLGEISLPIVNGDAETGDITGWTVGSNAPDARCSHSYTGTCSFWGDTHTIASMYQDFDPVTLGVPTAYTDADRSMVQVTWQQSSWSGSDKADVYFEFLDESNTPITYVRESGTLKAVAATEGDTWHYRAQFTKVPALTRTIRLHAYFEKTSGTNSDGYVDVIEGSLWAV